MNQNDKSILIIGAGPAGLTAAYELLDKKVGQPIIFEKTNSIGGISQTVKFKGNRIDIGGHRFFSKSDKVMKWWFKICDGTETGSLDDKLQGIDLKLLVRERLSRILYKRKFFDYPLSLSLKSIFKLGILNTIFIAMSYLKACFLPRKEDSLEDFFINRFGKRLYLTFFKSYTEKVWGLSCKDILADWGSQRIKGLSILRALQDAAKSVFTKNKTVKQKDVETSLIKRFLYPKLGPGQLWEEVADQVIKRGGELHLNHDVVKIKPLDDSKFAVSLAKTGTENITTVKVDYVISCMPVRDLVSCFDYPVPQNVQNVARGLFYRDFITVGVLLKEMVLMDNVKSGKGFPEDNWIYIQEDDVKIGRLQIFNNWSPYMVSNPEHIWVGAEYFCNEGDSLWEMSDSDLSDLVIKELVQLGFACMTDVLDTVVIKMPKAYPGYFGSYKQFDQIRGFTDSFENLFLIGRNGMHRYNNMDHSMLTAMIAVDNIKNGETTKDNIWQINAEAEYHEQKVTSE